MWIISGPFDADHSEHQAPEKSKLLKTGRKYGLGRREQPLQIKNKAISKTHALFVIADCTDEQAADPSFAPTLTFHNTTNRSRPIERPSQAHPRIVCQPSEALVLVHGDIIHLSATIYVKIRWEEVCCYAAETKALPRESITECASLGIHLVPTLHPSVTHHLISKYDVTAPIATSLVAVATLVKPEWLAAVLSSGNTEKGELSSLEEHFVLPPTNKFRPSFQPSLPSRLKKYDLWEPNEERAGMFRGRRFIFVGEKGAEAPTVLKDLVKRAEGDYECLAVEKAREGLKQVLAKGNARGATLVLIAQQDGMAAAIGKDKWAGFVEEARNFELKFIPPGKIVEAVVYADVSYVDCSVNAEDVQEQSVLPDVIPNTMDDEPSVVQTNAPAPLPEPEAEPAPASQPAPKRRLTRRATFRASSRAPSPPPAVAQEPISEEPAAPAAVEEAPAPKPPSTRRTLVRRARAKVAADDSVDLDNSARVSVEPESSENARMRAESIVPPTPVKPSRLKRRVGTQAQSAGSQVFPPSSEDVFVSEAQEPDYKRYKPLFDSYDPDKIAQMHPEEYGSQQVVPVSGVESVTQFEPSASASVTFAPDTEGTGRTGMGTTSRTRTTVRSGMSGALGSLGPLMEEEEESTMGSGPGTGGVTQSQTQSRGTKRKTQEDEDGDEEMGDDDADVRPRTKRKTGDEGAQSSSETQRKPQPQKPVSQIVTRVDMAQSHVHVKPRPPTKKEKEKEKAGPDRDDAFLKAVATTKRGKKTEDSFDREFNNLRISKPDLERDGQEEQWKVLDDFGDDGDMRGNFMVVVEMPLYRNPGAETRDHLRRGEGRVEWQGRPDFKKFKRKNAGEMRQPVELVVEENNDLGIGSQYWKGASQAAPSQSQSQPQSQPKSSTTLKSTQRSTKVRPTLISDESDEDEPVVKPSAKGKGKAPAKSQSSKPPSTKPPSTQSRSSTRTTRGKGSQRQPLFIDSDIEEQDEQDEDFQMGMGSDDEDEFGKDDEDGEDEPVATMKSATVRGTQTSAKGRATAGRKKAPAIVVDDDSDDGATFKAIGSRTRSRR
ncbi:hypothetical protein L226DRAFT_536733 [Lentinus tigrinus ALCF2SS1-7]|uniref:FHA domain-containing protein n=1 Tax=Lentinus tigrinus ALCF2SS1-6 TaxID=1328759 RepID=A0A5C2S587_9APHY|nr:hypothetical protein L227DRAFT_594452 [Lentinus tigrinus ALCF2SS1-6]RPD72874.1 hypothetical protein L226DRAFT_536733 [Lentinus tigrinus ALCF2SS1-7]